jgi:hypothetical protein
MHGSSSLAAKAAVMLGVAGGLAVPFSTAIGGGNGDLAKVSVNQLQTPRQLPQTPSASVPVPQVPHVQTPSVPSVQTPSVQTPSVPSTPSVPHVGTPSVPSVRTPSVPGASVPSTGATGGSSGASATPSAGAAGGSSSSSAGVSGASASKSSDGRTPKQRARARERRRAHNRTLRREVRAMQGCLPALPETQRRVLSLRAGLDGDPRSRGETASELGLTRAEERSAERRGLRGLRGACGAQSAGSGSSGGTTPVSFVEAGAHTTPALEPQALLAAAGPGKPLKSQDELQGQHDVKGVVASGGDGSGGSGGGPANPVESSIPLAAATTSGTAGGVWVAIVAALVLMTAVAVFATRRFGGRARPAAAGPPVPVLDVDPVAMAAAGAAATAGPAAATEPVRRDEPGGAGAAATAPAAATEPVRHDEARTGDAARGGAAAEPQAVWPPRLDRDARGQGAATDADEPATAAGDEAAGTTGDRRPQASGDEPATTDSPASAATVVRERPRARALRMAASGAFSTARGLLRRDRS